MQSTNGHGPRKAILYARVSTEEQARSGYSLAQQLEALREYAAHEGYEVVEEVPELLEQRRSPVQASPAQLPHLQTPAQHTSPKPESHASSHTFAQTGPFRPHNLHPTLENVVFTGSGTQPGVGVPMVLISGKLAAGRVLGRAA